MVEQYVPDIGHIVWLSLDPRAGREQTGRRPFLVLTPKAYNEKTSLVVGCPVTSRSNGYPFEVSVTPQGQIHGVVLADHVKSLDWRKRDAAFAAAADPSTIRSTRMLIATLLGI